MVESFTIRKMEDVLAIATRLRWYWFRGHEEEYKELDPRVFRRGLYPGAQFPLRTEYCENNIANQFLRKAPSLSITLNLPTTKLDWLCLMQHYGVPTRLLDWTESVIVAMYFVVRNTKKHNVNGELWAMFPPKLNKVSLDCEQLPSFDLPFLHYLATTAFSGSPHRVLDDMKEDFVRAYRDLHVVPHSPSAPVAFEPTLAFPRMNGQMSVFTIHPMPGLPVYHYNSSGSKFLPSNGKTKSIISALTEPDWLVRYVIPADSKLPLLQALISLGITEKLLFADLESLGRDLSTEMQLSGPWESTEPPRCGGPWVEDQVKTP